MRETPAKKRKPLRRIRMLCLVIMAVCLFRIGQAACLSARNRAAQEELRELVEAVEEEAVSENGVQNLSETKTDAGWGNGTLTDTAEQGKQAVSSKLPAESETPQTGSGIPGEEGGRVILKKYRELYLENGDVAGWLSIEGTKIDYPVMQCGDDEYYLHHDFYGEDSKYGCLYVRERADLEEGVNFVVYGHNMRDGSMFGELDLYGEEDFYREHSRISFDTLYEERTYEIMAVYRSRVYDEKDEVFKYYQFYEAETEAEFADFYENCRALSLYDTGVEAAFGDTFLTLSTCAYHVTDGRFVVVAKRIV